MLPVFENEIIKIIGSFDQNKSPGLDEINNLANKIGMINNELQKVTDWFKANKLSINVDKTNFMIMGTPQKTFKFKNDISVLLDGRCLSRVNKTTFLGVIIVI